MANQWFKFYASDYLNEVKFKGVDANKRSCFITALCFAAERDGKIDTRYLTEDILRMEAGVLMGGEAWLSTEGFYKWMVGREFGFMEDHEFVFKSWQQRQETNLTGYERVKRHREKNKDVINDNAMITLEENREDKKRIEKSNASLSFLTEIPESDLKELREKYEASIPQIKRKAEELKNYCDAKGKTYKNYRAFLENALARDFGRRLQAAPVTENEKRPMTADQQAAFDRVSAEVRALGIGKRVSNDHEY